MRGSSLRANELAVKQETSVLYLCIRMDRYAAFLKYYNVIEKVGIIFQS